MKMKTLGGVKPPKKPAMPVMPGAKVKKPSLPKPAMPFKGGKARGC